LRTCIPVEIHTGSGNPCSDPTRLDCVGSRNHLPIRDRLSADQVVFGPSQLDIDTHSPKIKSKMHRRVGAASAPTPLIRPVAALCRITCPTLKPIDFVRSDGPVASEFFRMGTD